MTILFLIAIVVVLILVILMFFILKSTVKKINSQTKLYFVDKLQEYDYMIDDKLNQLNQINEEIKEKELKREEQDTSADSNNYEFDYKIIDLLNKTVYQDKNVFELNKEIDEKFQLDSVSLIKKFLENVKDNGAYQFCLNLRNKFSSDVIYQLKIMLPEDQDEYFKKILNEDEYKVFDVYKRLVGSVSIDSFLDYLDELVDLNSPYVLVYVGKKDENYDSLSKYVKTIYSKGIYKGIKIVYRKKIYDYSLNERNV